jgi:hypothetical protein
MGKKQKMPWLFQSEFIRLFGGLVTEKAKDKVEG